MGKFIVDTSVWIDFFRGKLQPLAYEFLTKGIRNLSVCLTDIIRHEILMGAANEGAYKTYQNLLSDFNCYRIAETDLMIFDRFSWDLVKIGLRGSYPDVSIVFLSLQLKIPVMAFDDYFHHLDRKGIIRTVKY